MKTLGIKTFVLKLAFLIVVLPGSVFAVDILKDGEVIWKKDKNVFIKYDVQDKTYFGNNDHPVELNVEEISEALQSLKFPDKDGADKDKEQRSVFTNDQISLLSQNLSIGLRNAKPNQDIVFALEKSQSNLFGLITSQFFVAGRAFYNEGKLNIIIGDYDRARDKGFEAAYDPTKVGIVSYQFDFGSRSKSSRKKTHGFKENIVNVQGMENKQLNGVRRNDWLVIDLKVASEASELRAKMQKQEEIERKRKELKEILGTEETSASHPASVPAPSPVLVVPATIPTTTTHSPEERLRTLNNLKNKGLITDEEYAAKRKQILEEL